MTEPLTGIAQAARAYRPVARTGGVSVRVAPPTPYRCSIQWSRSVEDSWSRRVRDRCGWSALASRRCTVALMAVFTRISTDPSRMAGAPCIRGLRFPVASVVAMVADGMSEDEILAEHPDLERDDIREALRFAALAVQERQLPLLRPA